MGGPPPSLPGVQWPLVAELRARAAPSGVFGGLAGLDPQSVSLALVLWCAVVRCAAPCRVLPCCVLLLCAVLRCALLDRAVWRRVVLWCAAQCRVASRRAVVCCIVGCLVVVRCTVVRCSALCRAASCFAVVGRWMLVRPVVVRSAGRSVAGWWLGDAVRSPMILRGVVWP